MRIRVLTNHFEEPYGINIKYVQKEARNMKIEAAKTGRMELHDLIGTAMGPLPVRDPRDILYGDFPTCPAII